MEGGCVRRHDGPIVQDLEGRKQGRSGAIEFDCCQGESLCCRDLGRFRKSEKCVTGSTARVGVATYANGPKQSAYGHRGESSSNAAGWRARSGGVWAAQRCERAGCAAEEAETITRFCREGRL